MPSEWTLVTARLADGTKFVKAVGPEVGGESVDVVPKAALDEALDVIENDHDLSPHFAPFLRRHGRLDA